jgi:uncharacterized protein (DUF2336 family)
MSSRRRLDEAITNVLVRRGNDAVLRKVAGNSGARFSPSGFGMLAERARDDGALAEKIVVRADVPPHLFRALVTQATEVVQRHLAAVTPPETRAAIERALARISAEVTTELSAASNQGTAVELIRSMHEAGNLAESDVVGFAKARRFDETVAALAILSAMPLDVVDGVMRDDRLDPILILCKAAGLKWHTLCAVISIGRGGRGASTLDLDTIRLDFDKLSGATARRVLRFWQVRQVARANGGDDAKRPADGA